MGAKKHEKAITLREMVCVEKEEDLERDLGIRIRRRFRDEKGIEGFFCCLGGMKDT